METTEFDATIGGEVHLPNSVNSLQFATSRSVEIAAMTESILNPSKTKLIFQCLPVHMRRRVMSHNCKRLPRRLREGHLEQLKKSGLPPKQKRPPRKYRRRPGNLLEEYNRRQMQNIWLETHIWHAKRFHMTKRWGHRIAYAPCDKAFRACYRASSAHCLIQDISYYTSIQITGPTDIIKSLFSSITSPCCGLGICAKAYINGIREGSIHLYKANSFPLGYIGKIQFIWIQSEDTNKTLFLFVHPSQAKQVSTILKEILNGDNNTDIYEHCEKRRKLTNNYLEKIQIKIIPGRFNRFRLTGPNSHAILARSLKCVENIEKLKSSKWTSIVDVNKLHLTEKFEYWKMISNAHAPSQLPPSIVIGLIVKDPRLSRPSHRTKAKSDSHEIINTECLLTTPKTVSYSPLWDTNIQEIITKEKMNNSDYIKHVTKNQLVPGEVFEDDPALQCIPVVLIQRPGSQVSNFKKIGYGSGWDVIIPSGYGIQFWQTFIMFGARSGGLRETESLAFEMGECYLPPDSDAGQEEERRIYLELEDKYFKRPPSKRVNFIKLGINSPFICHWKLLLKDWCNVENRNFDNFFVLRDRELLVKFQDCISRKQELPQIECAEECLVAVYIRIANKGFLKKHALICLPENGDSTNNMLVEPRHDDQNEKLRKEKRLEHKTNMKRLRRKRIKLKKKATTAILKPQKRKLEPSEYVKSMRDLWLPVDVKSVRRTCSRQIMGYLTQAAFSFLEARSCGIGYVTYNALNTLLKCGYNEILVRNTTSRKYRLATLQVIQ
ncbi:ribonucleases P/MRP protein subunit POP1 [Galleria mellonella]|uniref:Ribonucleases P/MRP protein subunit POP1 n=1 Tax=Galleria mellonella TaxID=7137 RepID=A0A6J1X0M6_GALME|nr:ribonucleases P/MRP protein subunit POP1 [Galleria mellonella]